MATDPNQIRRCVFRPFRKGRGPVFALTLWETGRTCNTGQTKLRYRLTMDSRTLFEGDDYGCSPMHCIDSDASVEGIMGFLTVRPGDTDPEFFKDYAPAQLEYCQRYAEALSCEVQARFGERPATV